jgi:hypothetical protein
MATTVPELPIMTRQHAKNKEIVEEALRKGNLTVVVGAGVSMNAIRANKRMSSDATEDIVKSMSWLGLLQRGLEYLKDEDIILDQNELDRHVEMLMLGLPQTHKIQAASFLKRTLEEANKLDNWLDLEFDGIYKKCIDHDPNPILDSLRDLFNSGARFITTNYDDLLDLHINQHPIIPDGTPALKLFFRKRSTGICHVHGVWWHSKGTVLDNKDYQRTVDDESLQQSLKNSMSSSEVLLFVGAGAGLEDPNFGPLLAWAAKQNEGIAHRHYVLVRHQDKAVTNSNGLGVISYGADYKDLPVFLQDIARNGNCT